MEAHEAMERFERAEELTEARERFSRHAAVLVAVLAALLAVSSLAATNAVKDSILQQAKATDSFNELEANSLKKHVNTNDAALLNVLATGPNAASVRAQAKALEAKTASKYAPAEANLLPQARAHEAKSAEAERHHHGLEFAEAAFQIAIVLTSVAIIARARPLLFGAGALGIVGVLLLVDGFTLAVPL